MPNFVKLAATAKRLIDGSGRTISVIREAAVVVDSSQPWRSDPTPVTTTVTGKAAFVSAGSGLGITFITEAVRRGNQVCMFPADDDGGNDLTKFTKIADNLVEWQILKAEVLQPAETKLVYLFEVSR